MLHAVQIETQAEELGLTHLHAQAAAASASRELAPHTLRYRCARWGFPPVPTASASQRKFLRRLNIRPTRFPVNASTAPARAPPHYSWSIGVATPISNNFFIYRILPVLTGA